MSLERFRQHQAKPDYLFVLLVFILIIFGLIMIYAASAYTAEKSFGDSAYYFHKQFKSFLVGATVWLIFSKIDYRFWRKNALAMLIITLVLLIAVFIPGISLKLQGASRWISMGPIFFQPSEIAKFTFTIYLAAWLAKKGEGIRDLQSGFIPFAVIVGLVAFLIIKQPDMGSMSVIAFISAVMFIVAGASWQHISFGLASCFVFFLLLIKSAPYRFQRLLTFLNPSGQELGSSYHINQSLLGIGSGGLLGVGFGKSTQKLFYLPQAHTDSIFAIIVEELGFIRALVVVGVFILIAWRGLKIAKNAPDEFSRLFCVGIISWIMIQAFVNIAAMLGLIPLTGLPLPFVSYGGSSLVVLLGAIGVLTNISKQANR